MDKNLIDKFLQELEGENDEYLDRCTVESSKIISNIIIKNMQKWCVWDDEIGPLLMPNRTRLFYKKLNQSILVLEYPPEVRLLRFIESKVKNTYALALPYTIFIIQFSDGLFKKLLCTFSDHSLKSLKDTPLIPYLPNINDMTVCLGTSFDSNRLSKDDIVQQTSYVMEHFWSSVFSEDYSQNVIAYRDYFHKNGDERMISYSQWAKASTEDPLFVIDQVEWKPCFDLNYGDLISSITSEASGKDVFLPNDICEEISQQVISQLKSTIKENVKFAKEKVFGENS